MSFLFSHTIICFWDRVQPCTRTPEDATRTARAVCPLHIHQPFLCALHDEDTGTSVGTGPRLHHGLRLSSTFSCYAHASIYTSTPCHYPKALYSINTTTLQHSLSLSTKAQACIFSLGLSWLDKIKAMNIKFPFIPARKLKRIWK